MASLHNGVYSWRLAIILQCDPPSSLSIKLPHPLFPLPLLSLSVFFHVFFSFFFSFRMQKRGTISPRPTFASERSESECFGNITEWRVWTCVQWEFQVDSGLSSAWWGFCFQEKIKDNLWLTQRRNIILAYYWYLMIQVVKVWLVWRTLNCYFSLKLHLNKTLWTGLAFCGDKCFCFSFFLDFTPWEVRMGWFINIAGTSQEKMHEWRTHEVYIKQSFSAQGSVQIKCK